MNAAVFPSIPVDTEKAARAVFGRTNFYLVAGDRADWFFEGLMQHKSAEWVSKSIWNMAALYLITIFQYIETLPDYQAADALRKRIDWKYALHLPLSYPGLEPASLCEFRRWLRVDASRRENFQTVLNRLSDATDFSNRFKTSLEASQVITAVCQFNRLAIIWEALRQGIEALATRHPEWLLTASLPHWFERYGAGASLNLAVDDLEKNRLAKRLGSDGRHLLEAVAASASPELARLPELLTLKQVWHEQYDYVQGTILWRKDACASCVPIRINSNQAHNKFHNNKEVEL